MELRESTEEKLLDRKFLVYLPLELTYYLKG